MSAVSNKKTAPPITGPALQKITMEDPWKWLSKGWQDTWTNYRFSLAYGALFSLFSLLLYVGLFELQMSALVMVLASGYLIVAPMFAVGLYEASRRIERNLPLTFKNMIFVRTGAPVQLAYMGCILMLLFLAWIRLASLLYALFFGLVGFPPLEEFLPTLLFSPEGLWMLAVGSIVGGAIAFAVFVFAAISVPFLAHKDVDFMTAIITSVRAVRDNFWPMMLWAWLIAWFTAFGIATLFIGLIIVFPMLGHATWHAYRSFVPRVE